MIADKRTAALHNLPPLSTWRLTSSITNIEAKNNNTSIFYRTVQEHIYNQTGQAHSVDEIVEQVDNMIIADEGDQTPCSLNTQAVKDVSYSSSRRRMG